MRKLKKLASLLLALVMCFGLTCPAAFAEETTYSITINNSVEGYTYQAYQIFTGDYSGGVLSNIEWGAGVNSSDLLTALIAANAGYQKVTITEFASGTTYYTYNATTNEYTAVAEGTAYDSSTDYYVANSALTGKFSTLTTSSSASDVATILANSISADSADMEAFAEIVAANTSSASTNVPYDSTSSTYTVTGLEAGYYLIKNTGVPSGLTNTSYSAYMVRVVGEAEVNPKTSVPSSEKTVGDVSGNTTTYGTTADYAIGDDVPFRLTATLGTKYGEYESYALTFHDTLSDGLSFNSDSVTVTILDNNGTKVATVPATTTVNGDSYTNYTITTPTDPDTSLTDGCSFEIFFTDLKTLYDATGEAITLGANYKVQVDYTATLTEDAYSTDNTETNKLVLEYSNNPYDTSDTGKTPEDLVTVLSFKLEITKYANDTSSSNALNGAAFTLYKYDSEAYEEVSITEFASGTTYYTYDSTTSTYTAVEDGATYDSSKDYYVKGAFVLVETIDGTNTNVFTFDGLSEGWYKLVESVTPAGYNTMSDIYFTITATHGEDSDGTAYIKTLTLTQTDEDGDTTGITNSHTFNVETNTVDLTTYYTGKITTNIINYSGSSLPTTGGIGTTIFYMVGGVLVVGAAVLLITRSRMKNEDE